MHNTYGSRKYQQPLPASTFLSTSVGLSQPISLLNKAFSQLKHNLELSDSFQDTVSTSHNAVRGTIQNNGSSIRTKLIGGLGRETRIKPRKADTFDIDIIVEMGKFFNWTRFGGVSPQAAKSHLMQLLQQNKRYEEKNPQSDNPTITFSYENNVAMDIVPVYRDMIGYSPNGIRHYPVGRAYWVPKDGKWVLADYDYDAAYISVSNEISDKWLIPTIKMIKALKRIWYKNLESFALEIIAAQLIPIIVKTQKNRKASISFPFLITQFFNYAPGHLYMPIHLPNSLTPPIYLHSSTATQYAKTMQIIHKYLLEVNALHQQELQVVAWKELFGDVFPAKESL